MADRNDELPDVPALRTLEPPPNGLAQLRERLDADGSRPRWWLRLGVPAVALVAAAVILLVLLPRGERAALPVAEPGVALVAPPIPASPPRPLREPATGPDVEFYWVSSSHASPQTPPAPVSAASHVAIDRAPTVTVISPP